jgi:predicted heme/steroid binding protein
MKPLLMVLLLTLTFTLGACATDSTSTPMTEAPTTQPVGRTFTSAELAVFNGQNGQPAYVAVDGVVYDVTNNPAWSGGNHNGVQAGQDLTRMLPSSHRADMRFERNPIVGTFVE